MQKTLLVGLAGLLGTLARYWLSARIAGRYGETFPWGTLAVNVAGCFIAGALFFAAHERALVGEPWRTALLVGLLGGFTTFSAFGLQTFTLLREGHLAPALLNVAASNLLGLSMVWGGYALTKTFAGAAG
jgi:CrcB protein